MDEQLLMVLEKLGMAGLDAFYLYIVLDYASLWLVVGLIAWGVRAVWKREINDD